MSSMIRRLGHKASMALILALSISAAAQSPISIAPIAHINDDGIDDRYLDHAIAGCLSFTKAQAMSLASDPAIGEVRAQKEEAKAGVKIARSDWRPQLSTYGRTASGSTGLVDGRTDNQVGILVSQRIFDFGQGKFTKEAAKARLKAAEYQIDNASGDSLFETGRVFLQVLEAQERQQAARAREAQFSNIVGTLERRLEVNLITAAEASAIEGEHARAQANRIEEDLNLATMNSRLFILTGHRNRPCSNTDTVLGTLNARLPATMTSAITEARSYNPEVSALEAEVDAAGAEYQVQRRKEFPIIELQGAAAYILEPATAGNFFTQGSPANWRRSERIGIDVNVPLLGGGRYSAARSTASARKFGAEMSLERVRRDIESQVSLAWQRIHSGDQLKASRKKVRESLEAEAVAIRKEFENSLRPYQHVQKVEADLQGAILQEISAKYDVYYQRLLLLSLTNRLKLHTQELEPK